MSTALPPRPSRPRSVTKRAFIVIVASEYNELYTKALIDNTREELEALTENSQVRLVRVPGAYEIPVAVEAILRQEEPSCVITLGLIIKGQTAHGDMVAESVTHALQTIAVNHATPVIHEVVLVSDEKQAYARCIGSDLNRGREAARAAVSMINTFQQISRPPNGRSNTRNA